MDWGIVITVVLPLVTAVVGYVIKKFGADKVIGDLAETIADNSGRVMAVQTAITDAFKPDKNGVVELTADEVKNIYTSVDIVLEGFGIGLPDWPGSE